MEGLDGQLLIKILVLVNLIVTIAVGYKQIYGSQNVQISSQPIKVEAQAKAATDFELQEIKKRQERDHEFFRQKIDDLDHDFRSQLDDKVGDLHDKINGVAVDLAGVRKASEMQNQYLAQISTKIDQLRSES